MTGKEDFEKLIVIVVLLRYGAQNGFILLFMIIIVMIIIMIMTIMDMMIATART
jgi:hypothetical protein